MWEIKRLDRTQERSAFDCGNAVLNDWLKQRANQWDKKDLSRTYVLLPKGEHTVVGYYALSNHRVSYEALPADQAQGIPRIDVPVVLLGRLAVSQTLQGQGLGALLLVHALRRVSTLAEQVGVRAVEVDAIDEKARNFYLKHGFVSLQDDPNHLCLPMAVVRKLYPPSDPAKGSTPI
jgi:GNAT superfamily N-acetyltransferase